MIAIDFDGTLVDSYTIIPIIYKKFQEDYKLPEGFVDAMLCFEDIWDFFGIFERKRWIKYVFKDGESLWEDYWKIREENQVILPGTIEFLKSVKKEYELYLVSSVDDTEDIKIRRIKSSGLQVYFKDIIIYGTKDFPTILDAIKYLMEEEKKLIYIDDKNTNISKLLDLKNIKLIKRIFYPPFPFKLAWRYPNVEVEYITNLLEILPYLNV
ncbi:hypothetical protein BA065_01360 [Nanoarchaeota archaeon NZ13-N]|nr:MAG: hypothetical protein BA065_01360 [Nanoarchaeota archaeon NZ13-N]